jgi:hypothetical protein
LGLELGQLGPLASTRPFAIHPFPALEHGLQYGQDLSFCKFCNDFNWRWRTPYPQRAYFSGSLSRQSHGLPIVGARPIGSAIWSRMRCTLQRTASDIGRR